MAEIARGIVKRYVGLAQEYIHPFGAGAIATNGVQYAGVATVGTTAINVVNELVDAGFDLTLNRIQVGLTHRMTYLGSAAGSMTYYWKARSEWHDPIGTIRTSAYVNLTGTVTGPAGSAATNTYEDTWSGYVPLGSVSNAPIRLQLVAQGKVANSFYGEIKNSSYVKLSGIVIPGA